MALSHAFDCDIFPSDERVLKAMSEARSRWASKGLDLELCARLEQRLNELATIPTGRYMLVNGGWNGYWTNHLACVGCDAILSTTRLYKFSNETEEYLIKWFAGKRGEHELLLRSIIGPLLKPGCVVASVPCGLMSEVLLATHHFWGVKLYAIDIDKTNFDLIREKYGDRLFGNEFHPLEMDALTLDFECAFDLITCLGFVMYLKEERFPYFLSRLYRALKPGGRVLLSFLPDASEQPPHYPFDTARHPVASEIFMCTEVRFTTKYATSMMLRHFLQAGFVRITIHGGTYYQLPFVEAIKDETNN